MLRLSARFFPPLSTQGNEAVATESLLRHVYNSFRTQLHDLEPVPLSTEQETLRLV